jgi:hypothetical protein
VGLEVLELVRAQVPDGLDGPVVRAGEGMAERSITRLEL